MGQTVSRNFSILAFVARRTNALTSRAGTTLGQERGFQRLGAVGSAGAAISASVGQGHCLQLSTNLSDSRQVAEWGHQCPLVLGRHSPVELHELRFSPRPRSDLSKGEGPAPAVRSGSPRRPLAPAFVHARVKRPNGDNIAGAKK